MVKYLTIAVGALVGGGVMIGYKRMKESSKRLPDGSHVVIVGAGYAGISLADKIKEKGNYTIIDSRDSLHHNMAALRSVIEPGFSVKTFIPYKPKLGDHFKQGRVVGIDTANKSISLADQAESISYTHLVIATGSSGPFPGKCDYTKPVPELIKQYENYAQTIKQSQDVVIIGGGAVGVELAAEIAEQYPDKSVTIVHNGGVLVSRKLTKDALDRISKKLEEMKVKVILHDTVDNTDDLHLNQLKKGMVVKTSDGRQLQADLVIPCVGLTVNSEAYASSIPDKVNKKGQLLVDDYLQVKGLDNVYAIGDCNDIPVGKLAMESAFQADHLWQNLTSSSDPKPYKESGFKMVVPLGRDGGVMQAGTWVMGDWAAKRIKAKDVFVSMAWKVMGQPVPEKTSVKDE